MEQVHTNIIFLSLLHIRLWLICGVIQNLVAAYPHKSAAETYEFNFFLADITNYGHDLCLL